MTWNFKPFCASAVLLLMLTGSAGAQAPREPQPLQPDPTTLDESAPPGANYAKADFRFWAALRPKSPLRGAKLPGRKFRRVRLGSAESKLEFTRSNRLAAGISLAARPCTFSIR